MESVDDGDGTVAGARLKLRSRVEAVYKEATGKGVSHRDICAILGADLVPKQLDAEQTQSTANLVAKWSAWILLVLSVSIAVCVKMYDIESFEDAKKLLLTDSPCIVSNNGILMEVSRPLVPCGMCESLTEVPVERNISVERFLDKYAYTSVPVLIKDATHNWTAMSTFSFQYIKQLYLSIPNALTAVESDCQFFPYNTNFSTLREAFEMSDARANFTPGEDPWYFGWSNCDMDTALRLREHYEKPYFLPSNSTSSDLDWIFMGGTGKGANIHLDYVEKPSWQAQISGTKTWTLVPVPECEARCHSLNVTVHKGDIIVINTNDWYHSTFIHPGEISITIGSEYF